ncbi:DUF1800 family protein [Dokdonella sp.]|uniref:DUF1800 domain-containing protein n=1 Tax=Dokdonella sp. TaxID=2291710 RepID=UPI001B04059C|nr:DUF1800 family protein [Dokdonella sp.]MBO9662343.1 DUF1800 domain-containing protein [Dokdonella sp.]
MISSFSCRLLAFAAWVAAAVSSVSAQTPSHWPDASFRAGFESVASGPATDADAARFLAQATFGATEADIAHLRAIGYEAWLAEQFSLPATKQVPYLDWVRALDPDAYISDNVRLEAWNMAAAGTPDPSRPGFPTNARGDQLRQRVAFALSEIFVVSEKNGTLAYQPWALASYYDRLAEDAFGNYRDLLEDVTLHPTMGVYLSMIGNRKADAELNIRPDENYAREVMQLFSVGLVQLNPDGTPKLVGGAPVPTYGQATVRGFAAVFTGWIWNNTGCGANTYPCCTEETYTWCGPWDNADDRPIWQLPMQPVEAFHDATSDKQLLDYPGAALPAGVLAHGGNAQAEMQAALDNLFRHPNVGPFIATRLIQRLVTSNPSPDYVRRIAAVFDDDGSGVRGNLRALVRAILLDPEARYGHWQKPTTFGKLREPLLKNLHVWRAFHGRSQSGRILNLSTWPWIEDWYGQAPLRSPSVFNFFQPAYRPPGAIAAQGMVAPEFQILNDSTIVATPNQLFIHLFCYNVLNHECYTESLADTLLMDIQADAQLAAENPAGLVDAYDRLLMAGQMSPFMRSVLLTRLEAMTSAELGANLGRERVQHALYLIVTSPEYSIQK